MKKTILQILFLIILISPFISADGMMHIYDKDMWGLVDEGQQFCAINHKDGIQNMILTIETNEELKGEKAVWIFPIPAKPENTKINILKGFPQLLGYDIEREIDESISDVFTTMIATQIYPLPFYFFFNTMAYDRGDGLNLKGIEGIQIYESIEKMGLTTELVSAKDSKSLEEFILSKNLELPNESKNILNEYIGQNYSFVISWISNITEFNLKQGINERNKEYRRYDNRLRTGNTIGVFISFPTEKIYYPLKPTSVYGKLNVPAVIYVLDYVQPQLYPEIEKDTQMNYFYENYLTAQNELEDFFTGYEKEKPKYSKPEEYFEIRDIKYTKIKINTSSENLKQDLWMNKSVPFKVKKADFINNYSWTYGWFFFILISIISSFIAGKIIFRNHNISNIKLILIGIGNILTLIGLSIIIALTKIEPKNEKNKKVEKPKFPLKKFILTTLIISLIIPILFFIVAIFPGIRYAISHEGLSGIISAIILTILQFLSVWIILILIISPFTWAFYSSKRKIAFVALFTIFFMILTIVFSAILQSIV